MRRNAMRLAGFGVIFGLAACAANGTEVAPVAPNDVAFDGGAVAQSLTGVAGNAADGRTWFIDRQLGNCLACHQNSDAKEQQFHGEIGPSLDGVGGRWSEAELRGIVTNSKKTFEGTIMPGFYTQAGLQRVWKPFEGQTILSAQQVEDVVAYLMTLKE